jgi:hypothetical protein
VVDTGHLNILDRLALEFDFRFRDGWPAQALFLLEHVNKFGKRESCLSLEPSKKPIGFDLLPYPQNQVRTTGTASITTNRVA